MKSKGNLFENLCSYHNIRHAYLKAIRGKRKSKAVLLFSRNLEENVLLIQSQLKNLNPNWGNYKQFIIKEPKERIISAAPFSERVMHHAIMNCIENLFERHFIFHTYACRKGKGSHAAVKYAFRKAKSHLWFVKLDVRKYFDSIDHEVLKQNLRHLIKDINILVLLDSLIDSYHTEAKKGIPIGNVTSQYFANYYLSCLDHFVLEKLKAPAYARYMDDMLVFAKTKEKALEYEKNIRTFAKDYLKLELKPALISKTSYGIPFLGFLIKPKGIYLLQKSKRRVKNRFYAIEKDLFLGLIDEKKAGERAMSTKAAIALSRSKNFCARILSGSRLWLLQR